MRPRYSPHRLDVPSFRDPPSSVMTSADQVSPTAGHFRHSEWPLGIYFTIVCSCESASNDQVNQVDKTFSTSPRMNVSNSTDDIQLYLISLRIKLVIYKCFVVELPRYLSIYIAYPVLYL